MFPVDSKRGSDGTYMYIVAAWCVTEAFSTTMQHIEDCEVLMVVWLLWWKHWWLKSVALGSIPSDYQHFFIFSLFKEFSVYFQCVARSAKHYMLKK